MAQPEIQPHAHNVETVLLSCLLQPCLKISQVFVPQVWSITLGPSLRHSLVSGPLPSAERILSTRLQKYKLIPKLPTISGFICRFIVKSVNWMMLGYDQVSQRVNNVYG